MKIILCAGLLAGIAFASLPADAAVLTANSSNFAAVFAKAVGGDTVKLTGTFNNRIVIQNRSFASTVTINATGAKFTNAVTIKNVTGLRLTGGSYSLSAPGASAFVNLIDVRGGSKITIDHIAAAGQGTRSHGVNFVATQSIVVSDSVFTGLRSGVLISGVTTGTITRNISSGATSDGFNIADSHKINVTNNSCSNTNPSAGAHPDCVQLWSIKGNVPNSDIMVADNKAVGQMQGFTSFNGADGGGDRISFLRNRVDTSYPQGIACYECRNSTISGNILTTEADAKWRTTINVIGGYGNTVTNNSIGLKPIAKANIAMETVPWTDNAANSFTEFTPASTEMAAGNLGSAAVAGDPSISAVPEPALWSMMLTGFGLVGVTVRRRTRATHVSA